MSKNGAHFYKQVDGMNLVEVEQAAKELYETWSHGRYRGDNWGTENRLEYCLGHRAVLLNDQFRFTNEEFERFRTVAAMFAEKTELVFRNTCAIYRLTTDQFRHGVFHDFTDFAVEASVGVDGRSFVVFEDNTGSNYRDFAHILEHFYLDKQDISLLWRRFAYQPDVETDDEFFHRGFRWYFDAAGCLDTKEHEWLREAFPRLAGVPICHALHKLLDHTNYSLPDIIRINDLRVEVSVKWQTKQT